MNNLFCDTSNKQVDVFLKNFNSNYTNTSSSLYCKSISTKCAILASVNFDSDSIKQKELDLNDISFQKIKFASEKILKKIWDDPEEDSAWKNL